MSKGKGTFCPLWACGPFTSESIFGKMKARR